MLISLLLLSLACGPSSVDIDKPAQDEEEEVDDDLDGDGFAAADDCDDSDADVNDAAPEVCDDVDNDCDSLVDGEDPDVTDAETWYEDGDLDGRGAGAGFVACDQPEGYAAAAGDCDDADARVSPDENEVCDDVDNDCDDLVDGQDDSLTGGTTYYYDADGDGYAGGDVTVSSCNQPDGYETSNTDCDDGDGEINDGAYEVCDDVDNDCDGLVDGQDDDVIGESLWYADDDGDGYGDGGTSRVACNQPSGYVDNDQDCDDTNARVTNIC